MKHVILKRIFSLKQLLLMYVAGLLAVMILHFVH